MSNRGDDHTLGVMRDNVLVHSRLTVETRGEVKSVILAPIASSLIMGHKLNTPGESISRMLTYIPIARLINAYDAA